MSDENLTLEEKVDKILKYQTRLYRWQLARSIIAFLLFVIFIVVPIVWIYYWAKSIDLTGVIGTVQTLKETGTGSVDKLNELLNSIVN